MTPQQQASITREFNLSPETASQMDEYYVLHWEVDYFLGRAVNKNWVLTRKGISFIVLFEPEDTFATVFSKVCNPSQQVKLSFRKPPAPSCGFVIVKALNRYDSNI